MPDSGIRDRLALQRTWLANERTFLAYFRTALSMLAAGALLFEFFSDHPTYTWFAWLLMAGGLLVLGVGVFRFLHVRKRLRD